MLPNFSRSFAVVVTVSPHVILGAFVEQSLQLSVIVPRAYLFRLLLELWQGFGGIFELGYDFDDVTRVAGLTQFGKEVAAFFVSHGVKVDFFAGFDF